MVEKRKRNHEEGKLGKVDGLGDADRLEFVFSRSFCELMVIPTLRQQNMVS